MTQTNRPTDTGFTSAQLEAVTIAPEIPELGLGAPALPDIKDAYATARSGGIVVAHHVAEWENLLRSRIIMIVEAPPVDPEQMEAHISREWSHLQNFPRSLGDGSDDRLAAFRSLGVLLKRREFNIAREFLAALNSAENPSVIRNIRVLLHAAAARENYSPGRYDLVRTILRLIEYGFQSRNEKIMGDIVPRAIVFLVASPLDYRIELDLSVLLDDLFGLGKNTPDRKVLPDAEETAHDFLSYLLHHPRPQYSLASHFLYRLKMRGDEGYSRNLLVLMRQALREDMLRGTDRFDKEKLDKILRPLFDPDPKAQRLIRNIPIVGRDIDQFFLDQYEAHVSFRALRLLTNEVLEGSEAAKVELRRIAESDDASSGPAGAILENIDLLSDLYRINDAHTFGDRVRPYLRRGAERIAAYFENGLDGLANVSTYALNMMKGPNLYIDELLETKFAERLAKTGKKDYEIGFIVHDTISRLVYFFNPLTSLRFLEKHQHHIDVKRIAMWRQEMRDSSTVKSHVLATIFPSMLVSMIHGINTEVQIGQEFQYRKELDTTEIDAIFQELHINAFKYHSTNKEDLFIRISWDDARQVFTHEDNGRGIENTELVWEMGKREADRNPGVGGSGLGLASVYERIRRLGWRIELESEVGKGTRFTIYPKPGDIVTASSDAAGGASSVPPAMYTLGTPNAAPSGAAPSTVTGLIEYENEPAVVHGARVMRSSGRSAQRRVRYGQTQLLSAQIAVRMPTAIVRPQAAQIAVP